MAALHPVEPVFAVIEILDNVINVRSNLFFLIIMEDINNLPCPYC